MVFKKTFILHFTGGQMNRYIAFLRGINISGKNKINMSDLKAEFENMNFSDVSTYLNSGNVMLSSDNDNIAELKSKIEEMITERFGLVLPVYIIESKHLKNIISNAPAWWGTGDKDKYDNLVFILSSESPEEICDLIGQPSKELETIQAYEDVIFWTFDRKLYQKCNWWKKTASAGIAEKLTIRTANTVRKMCK